MNTIFDCGIKFNPITANEVLDFVNHWGKEGKKGIQITGVNIEQIALLEKNNEFASYINNSDIVNIDGTIVYLFLKLKGYKIKQKTLCADILYKFLHDANEKRDSIYLLGATQDTIEKVVENIHKQFPNIIIAGYNNGYFKDEKPIVEDIKNRNPKYVFLGMPSPMKERFITKNKANLNAVVCFGVGGMFDIIAGKASRAPKWIQYFGFEWLYRITQNPIGHTKRIGRALFPCLKVFLKNLFKRKSQIMN